MTGGSVAEPSYACIGFLPKQIVSGGLSRQSSASWNPGGTPERFRYSGYFAKLLILLEPARGLEPRTY